jgi:hypothetical protein
MRRTLDSCLQKSADTIPKKLNLILPFYFLFLGVTSFIGQVL